MNRFHALPLYALLIAGTAAAPAAMAQEASTGTAPQTQSWDALDTDSDGNLSKSEAASHSALAGVFDQADTNSDGQLSPAEYRDFIASRQAGDTSSTAADATPTTEPEPEEERPVQE